MRRPTSSAALAAVLLGAAGCAPADVSPADGPARALRVVGQFEVHSLDPATAGGLFTRLQVAETLVDAGPDGVLRPGLATEWTSSPDQREWRFTLRPDARFHDGTPVTAQRVVQSLDTARGQEGTPLATVPFTTVAADGDQVVVTLEEPFAVLPAVLAHTSAQVLAAGSYDRDGTVTTVVGSGPYEVTSVEIPSRVDLVASDDWSGEAPHIDRVEYRTVGRAESRALMAESGQADVTFGMDPTSLQRLTGGAGVAVESVTVPRTIMLKVNAGHPVLGDVAVRRAISVALDREAMAAALLRDPEMAATQLFPPSLAEWHRTDLPPLEHDPSTARALLAGAGWRPGPDGVLVRDGERFEVSLRTYPDRPELPVLATAVQAALRDVGIAVDVQVVNSSEIPAGHADGTLELGLIARNFSLVPDPLVTLLDDFDADGADFGAMGWSDPTVVARLGELAAVSDGETATTARAEISAVLQEQLPVIPVAWYRQSAVVDDRVAGVVLDPLERSWRLSEIRWAA